MATKRARHYTEILIERGIVSPDQLTEAEQMARQSDMKLPDALARLGYASAEDVAKAMAAQHGLEYIKLADVTVPTAVIELVPESVARENAILPLGEDDGQLRVVVSDPDDFETFEKLRFILNRPIVPVLAPRDMIVEAINRHYGQTVGESADTMLQEFTDTAIDFTEAEEQRLSGQEQIDESAAPIVR
ncbi:MAG: type II/IV secretion system protein, partial [Planctomycetota bacterium]|nr:type II/IV secretion system protein [Planctomycetota bacterium]